VLIELTLIKVLFVLSLQQSLQRGLLMAAEDLQLIGDILQLSEADEEVVSKA
jgi:hypothetical protein